MENEETKETEQPADEQKEKSVLDEAREKKAEEEEKKPRSVFKLFLGSLSVMAIFILSSIVVLMTDYEGKIISAIVYALAILLALFMVFVIPPSEEEEERRDKKKEEKQTKRSKNKKTKFLGILADACKVVGLVGMLGFGLFGIMVSNVLSDVIAISFLFAAMVIYFIIFANIE